MHGKVIIKVSLLGFLSAFTGMLIGGTIAWLFKSFQQKVDIIYGLCAGIIFGLISFEILPESIELGGWLKTFIGFTIGIILFNVLHKKLHTYERTKGTTKRKTYIRTSMLLLFSFSIHNVPMGIILGASQQSNFTTTLLQALLFHSIPEGIILFTPLILAGVSLFTLFFISFIVSLPIPLGVFIGGYLGLNHQASIAILISITLGLTLMVTISEIVYPALKKSSIVNVLLFILIGIGIIVIYLKAI